MDYISVKEAAEKWGISIRRIQILCEHERISGVRKFANAWAIPKDAEKPEDARLVKKNKNQEQKLKRGNIDD